MPSTYHPKSPTCPELSANKTILPKKKLRKKAWFLNSLNAVRIFWSKKKSLAPEVAAHHQKLWLVASVAHRWPKNWCYRGHSLLKGCIPNKTPTNRFRIRLQFSMNTGVIFWGDSLKSWDLRLLADLELGGVGICTKINFWWDFTR